MVAGCGGARGGDLLRPDALTAAGSLGEEASCDAPLGYSEPLVVDWSSSQRLDLEVAMNDGLVPVQYTCGDFRIVGGCAVRGSYTFTGVGRKEEVVQIENAAEVAANFRLSVATLAAEVQRGTAIDLAMVLVGKRSATARHVTRDLLEGNCGDATHVVRSATVGAFAMSTGARGQARAAAEVFSVGGGSASTASSKVHLNRDGDMAACARSRPGAAAPPEECGSAIRVELLPILAQRPASSDERAAPPDPCPGGFAMAAGKCTPLDQAPAHQCAPDNEDDCSAQCELGNLPSCHNLGRHLTRYGRTKDPDPRRVRAVFGRACEGGYGPSCSYHADTFLEPDGRKPTSPEVSRALTILRRGCHQLGDAWSCYGIAVEHKKGDPLATGLTRPDPDVVERYLERTCGLGEAQGCSDLARLNQVRGDTADARRWYERACDGGYADQCEWLGNALAAGTHGHVRDPAAARQLYAVACAHDDYFCFALGNAHATGLGTSNPDPRAARAAWSRACAADHEDACAKLKG